LLWPKFEKWATSSTGSWQPLLGPTGPSPHYSQQLGRQSYVVEDVEEGRAYQNQKEEYTINLPSLVAETSDFR
jgi:hypothetical protein